MTEWLVTSMLYWSACAGHGGVQQPDSV